MTDNKSGSYNFVYIGNDMVHWNHLLEQFKKNYPNLKIKPTKFYSTNSSEVQGFVPTIFDLKAKAIFIDFTQNSIEHLHLARLLARTHFEEPCYTCGLMENLDNKDLVKQIFLTGISSLYIKSNECDSLIYSCMSIALPNESKGHGFATADLADVAKVYVPGRASIINEDSILLESNETILDQEILSLHTHWSDKKLIYSPRAKLISQNTENLFYHFKYSQKFKLLFNDEYSPLTEATPEEEALNLKEYNDLTNNSKTKLSEWISIHAKESAPKLTKTLVIDKHFELYKNQEKVDQYPFTLRMQPFLTQFKNELLKEKADLIVYQFDTIEYDEEGKQTTTDIKNNLDGLIKLIQTIKVIENYHPFILVFNTKLVSPQEIKNQTQYEHMIINPGIILPELIIKMANLLNQKLQDKFKAIKENTVYLNKNDSATYAEIERDVTITKISENDLCLTSDHPLPMGIPLRMLNPIPMGITIIEPPKHMGQITGQYALINAVGEGERMKLRQFINSVFFRAKMEEKEKEAEAFRELNEKAKQEKEKENS